MNELSQYIHDHGLPLIFGIVLLAQLGVPIPAMPVLIVAGALAVDRDLSATSVIGVSVAASLLADYVWFELGRARGHRILKLLCRISLSPDSCVRQTESLYHRLGDPALLVAKFIPGFSTVAPPLAGAMGTRTLVFLFYDGGGALLWVGVGVVGGMIFHSAIDGFLAQLSAIGGWAFLLVAGALTLFVAYKYWQRRSFYQFLRMARISVDDLRRAIDSGKNPLILDVRSSAGRAANPQRIQGAAVLDADNLDGEIDKLPRGREIILYCT